MTKKAEFCDQARELFVIHGLSLRDIAVRLDVSERTLNNWKREDEKNGKGWETAKTAMLGTEHGFHAELFRLGQVVARKIREDLEKPGGQLDDRIYHLAKIIEAAEKSRKYEAAAPPTQAKDKETRTPEETRMATLKAAKDAFGLG